MDGTYGHLHIPDTVGARSGLRYERGFVLKMSKVTGTSSMVPRAELRQPPSSRVVAPNR